MTARSHRVGHGPHDLLPGRLVLLRHGESTANAAGLFTGILDVPLTCRGEREARGAGTVIASAGLSIGSVVTSTLQRATRSAELVLDVLGPPRPPSTPDRRLDERSYGALTGRTKAEVLDEVGPDRFLAWRRSMTEAPPPMTAAMHRRITASTGATGLPGDPVLTESLRNVVDRVRPLIADTLLPRLGEHTVLVVAHGNSLRAVIALIDRLDDVAVEALNLPTGQPLVYRLTTSGWSTTTGGHWLDVAAAVPAAARIAHEGGT